MVNDLVTLTLIEAKNSFLDFVAAGGIVSVSQTHLDFLPLQHWSLFQDSVPYTIRAIDMSVAYTKVISWKTVVGAKFHRTFHKSFRYFDFIVKKGDLPLNSSLKK